MNQCVTVNEFEKPWDEVVEVPPEHAGPAPRLRSIRLFLDCIQAFMDRCRFTQDSSGQNQALVFVRLKDWEERQRPDQKVKAIQGRAMEKFLQYQRKVLPLNVN